MKIFVDDLRLSPEKYDCVFLNGEDFISWLKDNPEMVITLLSLDHDLGDKIMDGYELVKQLVDLMQETNIKVLEVQFHTDNFVGLRNMYHYLESAKRAGVISEETIIHPYKVETIDGEEIINNWFKI